MKKRLDPYENKPGYYWFSFAGPRDDPRYTGRKGFLGVAIVYEDSYDEGLGKTWELKINPGGWVQGSLMGKAPNEKWCNRLLSRESVEEMGKEHPKPSNN
jgi:hypothetical protein